MSFKATDCFMVFGIRGSGKSYLAKQINKEWPRTIIIDPMDDFPGEPGNIFYDFNKFADRLADLKNKNEQKFRLIFRFKPTTSVEEQHAIFEQICCLAYHFGNLQLVVDEIHDFHSPHYLPPYLKKIIFTGRHRGVSYLGISQRPARVHKDLVSQCPHVFIGLVFETNDVNYFRGFLGDKAELTKTLPERNFVYFQPRVGIKIISTDK